MTQADSAGNGGFDPGVARALDRFDVPPPSDGFIARMAAIADVAPVAATGLPGAARWQAGMQRGRRSLARAPWARRTAIGIIAFGLASATAAAAGMFESVRFEIPVIARLLAPAPAAVPVAHATRPKPRAPSGKVAVAEPALPDPAAGPVAPMALTRAERIERLRSLPMPVRAVMTERMVTRTQQRLAARGVFLPRAIVRDRVIARTGQTDLPRGTPAEKRAQLRAALIAAPPGSLPPRLERLRARALAQDAAGQAGQPVDQSAAGPDAPRAPAINSIDADRAFAQQGLREWREMRRERRRRWQARQADLAQREAGAEGTGSVQAAPQTQGPALVPTEPAPPRPPQ